MSDLSSSSEKPRLKKQWVNAMTPQHVQEASFRLAKLIRDTREAKGLGKRDLERLTGVSDTTICQIESGHHKNPSFFSIIRLCDGLGISLEDAANTIRAQKELLL